MHTQIIKRLVSLVIPTCLLFLSFAMPAQAAADFFLKFDGVDGESTSQGHEAWIEILSVSESISKASGATSGSTRTRGAPIFEDIVFVKELDKTSPRLRQSLAQGRVYPEVLIDFTSTCGGGSGRVTYFKYELKNVLITSFSLNGSAGAGAPVEQLSLNFEEIKWTYTEYGPDCSKRGDIEASYRKELGTP